MRYTTSFLCAAWATLGLQVEQKPMTANPFTDEFADFARETLRQWHVAGLSISVVDGGHVFAEGYGFATLPDVPATPDTLWYVGSTTKAHVAAALAHIIDSRNYSSLSRGWRTPISSLIRDDFVLQDPWSTAHVTLEDAASHGTGLTAHDASVRYHANRSQHIVRDTVRNLRNLPLHLEPRLEFHYSNVMYTALGHVIETLTGKWLGHVIKDTIWSPLGMTASYFDLEEAKDAPEHLSTGYYWHRQQQEFKAMPLMPTDVMNASGAMISTVVDFAKWIKCLLRASEPLSKAVHKEIRKPRIVQNPEPAMGTDVALYSLAWWRTTIHGQVAYWHSGSVGTHGALVHWFPDLDYGVVIFTNFPNPARQVLMWRLIEDKLRIPKDRRYDMAAKMRESEERERRDIANATNILFPDRPDTALSPSLNLSDFEGRYHNKGYGAFELRQEPHPSEPGETILVADRDDFEFRYQMRLYHVSGDFWTLYAESQDRPPGPYEFNKAQFTVGPDGNVAALEVTRFDREEMVLEGVIVYEKTA
ncbi:Beta-lactamase/transpeptidase-like protein [Ophiocordyceps sinensis CO18]|uniref:Beta-lactamase/transpeptidase-like protein n=1 Tax=Ophiocordyceps sinensis (strain Co18 / CGMCC 3.14243) TaxID=911162 RepID=T5ABY0_OPHSC|nr:Beta-lactamase/transpeptidase-like protein [Ophiocordyceps sinensis CO18]